MQKGKKSMKRRAMKVMKKGLHYSKMMLESIGQLLIYLPILFLKKWFLILWKKIYL